MNILLDNSVVSSLTRNGKGHRAENFSKTLNSLALFVKGEERLITTPFGMLELCGFTIDHIAEPTVPNLSLAEFEFLEKNLQAEEVIKWRTRVYDEYKTILDRETNIKTEKIKERCSELVSIATEQHAKELIESIVANTFNSFNTDDFYQKFLALDRLYAHPVPNHYELDFLSCGFVDQVQFNGSNRNNTMMRAFDRIWKNFRVDIRNRVRAKFPSNKSKRESVNVFIQNFEKAMALKQKSDLLDTETIMFACLGFAENLSRKPVVIFTTEPPDTIEARIALFKSVMIEAWDLYKKPIDHRKFVYGHIVCVDPDCNYKITINSKEVKPLFHQIDTLLVDSGDANQLLEIQKKQLSPFEE